MPKCGQINIFYSILFYSIFYIWFGDSESTVSVWKRKILLARGLKSCKEVVMYSAHLSRRASAPTHHNWQFNEEPKDPRKEACHTKGGIPAIPRAKPEGKSQAGSQPMRRRLGRRDYSSLKIAGTRTGIPDHSCPPLLPLQHPHSPLPPPCHRALADQ